MDTTSIWPDQLDSPATLPPRVDNRDYNLAVDINESREFMQKAERIIGEMAHGGGVTNFYCTTPDVPGLRVKIAGGVAWFSDTTLVRKQAGPYVSPDITPPVTNPRIDLLTLDSSGVFAWTQGVENASPVVPAYPTGKYPVCEIYTRPTMTTVLARPEDDDLTNGYIRYPIAPFASLPFLPPASTGGHDIYDEVTLLPTQPKLRFKGSAITAADNPGASATDITVAVTTADITGQLADTRINSGVVNDGITQPSSDAAVTLDERINDLAKMLRVTTGTANWYDSPDATNNGLWAKFHDTTGHTHSGTGNNGPQLTNAGIAVGAGIVYAKLALAGGIVNADINAAAAIAASKIAAGTFTGTFVGNADTATLLQTARTINGVSFDGGSNIVVAAAAGTLTGATLAANVLASSLTSLGTLSALTVTGLVTANGGLTVVGALTLPTGSITSAMILNDTILNADINSAAAIDYSKLALTNSITSGDIVSLVASKVTPGTFATGAFAFAGAVSGITTLTATSLVGALTGNASTATALATARAINGVNFDGTAAITVAAAAGTLTGATLAANVLASSLTSVGVLSGLTIGTISGVVKASSGVISASTLVDADISATAAISASKIASGTFNGTFVGNASTATALQTARTINGVAFDGTANITISSGAADAGLLTGTTLAANVVNSSLTSVGTLAALTVTGDVRFNGHLGFSAAPIGEAAIYLTTAVTASSGGAYGIYVNPTITAAVNSDVLYGVISTPILAAAGHTSLTYAGFFAPSRTLAAGFSNGYGGLFNAPTAAANNYAIGVNGHIIQLQAADASPYTQARLTVYYDGGNWGYFAYGSDASMRFIHGATGAGAPLIFGTSSAINGTGTIVETMRLTGAGVLTVAGGLTLTAGTLSLPTGSITSTMILDGTILNVDINSAAAIAYSKLTLTNSIVSGDIVSLAASKVTAGTFATGAFVFPSTLSVTTNLGVGGASSGNVGVYITNTLNATSAVAAGIYAIPTLTAAVNGDSLIGSYFNPTVNANSKTGLAYYGMSINSVALSSAFNLGFSLFVAEPTGATGNKQNFAAVFSGKVSVGASPQINAALSVGQTISPTSSPMTTYAASIMSHSTLTANANFDSLYNIAVIPTVSANSKTNLIYAGIFVEQATLSSGFDFGYGLYIKAPVSAANGNYAAVFTGGNVGIGTTTPISITHVYESGTAIVATASDVAYGLTVEGRHFGGTDSSALLTVISNDTLAQNKGGSIGLGGKYSGNAWAYFAGIRAGKLDGTSGNYGGYLALRARSNAAQPTDVMYIYGTGKVGINISPASAFHVYWNGAGYPMRVEGGASSQAAIELWDGAGTQNKWVVASGAASATDGIFIIYDQRQSLIRMRISTAGLYRWEAYGAGTLTSDASGNITAVSDERLKDNIRSYEYGLDAILKTKPIIYNWNKKSEMDMKNDYVGFSAQNILESIPYAVGRNLDGMLTLQDRPLLATAFNAIKELNSKIERLERIIGIN